jgi:hypothetical protein
MEISDRRQLNAGMHCRPVTLDILYSYGTLFWLLGDLAISSIPLALVRTPP